MDSADDVGVLVGGFEQRAPCQPVAAPFGGGLDARGRISSNGFRGEPELVEQGDRFRGGRDPLESGRTRSSAAGLRLGVDRIRLVAGHRLSGGAVFGGLPGEVTAPVDSGCDSVFARIRARAVDVCGQHRGQTEVFGGSRPRGARGSIQPGRASPAGRCGLGLRGRTGLDELVEVLAHGVLMQTGHGRQGRDRHGTRLGGEVLVHEGDRRGQSCLRNRRFGPERRRILICTVVCVAAIVFHGSHCNKQCVVRRARPMVDATSAAGGRSYSSHRRRGSCPSHRRRRSRPRRRKEW